MVDSVLSFRALRRSVPRACSLNSPLLGGSATRTLVCSPAWERFCFGRQAFEQCEWHPTHPRCTLHSSHDNSSHSLTRAMRRVSGSCATLSRAHPLQRQEPMPRKQRRWFLRPLSSVGELPDRYWYCLFAAPLLKHCCSLCHASSGKTGKWRTFAPGVAASPLSARRGLRL